MKQEKNGRRRYAEHLGEKRRETLSQIARDSLAIETLGELAVFSAALPYQSFVAVTLTKIMTLMGAATGSIFGYDAVSKSADIVLWQGLEADDVELFSRQKVDRDSPGLAAACIRDREPILVENPLDDRRLATPYFRKTVEKYGLTGAIAMPLIKEARVYGAMVLFTAGRNKFDSDDVSFLRAVAMPVAAAFEAQARVAEINRERERLWNIFESLFMGVIFLDGAGTITACNKTALKLLGMEEGMLSGKTADNALFPYFLNAGNEQAYTRFADVRRDKTEEVTYITPFGRVKQPGQPVLWNARLADMPGGGSVFVFSDACRKKEFFASQTALAEAAVKYVRRPVRSMMEAMSMVALSGDLNSRQFENLERAQSLAAKMWQNLLLAEKSMQYAGGDVKPEKEAFRAEEIIDRVRKRRAETAKSVGAELICRAETDDLVYGDPMMLTETIDVAVADALGSIAPGTRLFLSVGSSGRGVKIKISSDKPPKQRAADPLSVQYLRSFFAFIKGDIDFNPPAENPGEIPLLTFFIPA